MPLELFKFVVQPVLLRRNGDGEVDGEQAADAVALYSSEKLCEWASSFDQMLADLNQREQA